jgi:hypothetical protein
MTNEHKPSERSLKVARLLLADEYTSKKLDYRIALALDAAFDERAPKRLSESELEKAYIEWGNDCVKIPKLNNLSNAFFETFKAGYRFAVGEDL